MAGGGGSEAVEETGVLEAVEPAERGEEALADPAVVEATVFDKLHVGVLADGFDAEEHEAVCCHYKYNTETIVIHRLQIQLYATLGKSICHYK